LTHVTASMYVFAALLVKRRTKTHKDTDNFLVTQNG
jgi:hypothetical protein